jgi:type VI secretion system secreted protein VgrG
MDIPSPLTNAAVSSASKAADNAVQNATAQVGNLVAPAKDAIAQASGIKDAVTGGISNASAQLGGLQASLPSTPSLPSIPSLPSTPSLPSLPAVGDLTSGLTDSFGLDSLPGFTNVKSLIASGASPFQQSNRIITLELGAGRIASEQLIPQTVQGTEALSEPYRFEIVCSAPDAHLELKNLLGQPARLGILTGAGQKVLRCGIITHIKALPSDGGSAHYQLTFEPPLTLLKHRRTSRVFQDQSVPAIVQTILDEHIAANPVFAANFAHRFDLSSERYPERSYCIQYRETDFAFIDRLLREEGISYRFEHTEAENAPEDEGEDDSDGELKLKRPSWEIPESDAGTHPLVTLVAFDDPFSLPQASQNRIRFHRANATEADDTLTGWTSARQLGIENVTHASFEYKSVRTQVASASTQIDQSALGHDAQSTLEDYDAQTHYYGDDEDMERYARLRQQAHDRHKKVFHGEGNVRQLRVGDWFELTGHPQISNRGQKQREFVVEKLTIVAHNNVPDGPTKLKGGDTPPPYRITLEAQRRSIPLTPDFAHTTHAKPQSNGRQTATVVGPLRAASEATVPMPDEVYTDTMGRIKIQFHWQRPQEHPEFGANRDEKSSCWVRVAYPSAGAGWGHQFIPRIGQEVAVDFLEGDIDRPIVTGVIHNGTHTPPKFSGAGSLPANRALSGIKTKEHEGYQYGELLFDDTPEEVRTKLSSEHGKTQLNQGYLIHPRSDGKGAPRGDGFELRTDRHGSLRAAQGLLLSTEAQPEAQGKQLDRDKAQARLDAARTAAATLSENAQAQLAAATETGPEALSVDGEKGEKQALGHLDHLTEAVRAWENSSNTASPDEAASSSQPGQQPLLLINAPAGLGLTSPSEIALVAEKNLDTVSLRHTQQTTGRRWIHNVGKRISLYVYGIASKVNLKLIAAKGHAWLKAQKGDVEIIGDKNVRFYANRKQFEGTAGEELLLNCGGAYIRLKGGKIDVHAPGLISIKAANVSYPGPDNKAVVRDPTRDPQGCGLQNALAASKGAGLVPL